MFYVAAVLVVLSGLFYAASHHEIGTLGVEMCRYGSTFCERRDQVMPLRLDRLLRRPAQRFSRHHRKRPRLQGA